LKNAKLGTKLLLLSKTFENFGGKENGLSTILLIDCYAKIFPQPKISPKLV
jgi:hypothetical protein